MQTPAAVIFSKELKRVSSLMILYHRSNSAFPFLFLVCKHKKIVKGARSRNFRQFQHCSNGHRIN